MAGFAHGHTNQLQSWADCPSPSIKSYYTETEPTEAQVWNIINIQECSLKDFPCAHNLASTWVGA